MPKVHAKAIQAFVTEIFKSSGVPLPTAERVSQSLVASDLAGHESHGVVRVFQYLESIREGRLDPDATPHVAQETATMALIDGGYGFGQVAAHKAITIAVEKADTHGLAAAGIRKSGHVGRLGEWVELAAHQGLIGIGFSNGGIPGGLVAPYGGSEPALGTNPVAAAFPVQGQDPVLVDFASSVVAEGKVRLARDEGAPVPDGWLLDARGQQTTNPAALYEGGMLTTAAGHKGYGLSLMVEFLGGLLTGAGCAILPGFRPGNGVFFLVISIEQFGSRKQFERQAADLVRRLKNIQPAAGHQEVLVPGDPEHRTARTRAQEGIPLDDGVWTKLESIASSKGIAVPSGLFVQ